MLNYAKNLPSGLGLELVDEMTVRKTGNNYNRRTEFLQTLVSRLEREEHPLIVHAHNFQSFTESGTKKYSYDMKRLGILSRSEKDLITNFDRFYWNHSKSIIGADNHPGVQEYLTDYPQLFKFLSHIYVWHKYTDIHSGNIMMDEDRSYRLIDLEGFNMGTGDPITPSNPFVSWLFEDWSKQGVPQE